MYSCFLFESHENTFMPRQMFAAKACSLLVYIKAKTMRPYLNRDLKRCSQTSNNIFSTQLKPEPLIKPVGDISKVVNSLYFCFDIEKQHQLQFSLLLHFIRAWVFVAANPPEKVHSNLPVPRCEPQKPTPRFSLVRSRGLGQMPRLRSYAGVSSA